uniref:Uncharacterized protein n=2 Tax=viral metagenome TaxID=1070528 RepID=A0A6M3LW53_9ZZZZ
MAIQAIQKFKGLKNDEDIKQVPLDYFYSMKNFNYLDTGLLGIEKITFPEQTAELSSTYIDGLFEYKYLDSSNVLQTEYMGVTGGSVYKDVLTTPVLLKSGLNTGKVSFAIFNDKLFIANGSNYINIYDGNIEIITEMGAPYAEVTTTPGNPDGTYYYAMTYVTAGGEEVLGSVSNTVTVSSEQVTLYLPLGYTGTLQRKLYRTVDSGTTLKLLATVADNTTLTYTDNIADGSLGANIPAVNNELPKPYFLSVASQKIFATVVNNYPTQVFITDTNIDVLDAASALDVANYGADNTSINAIGNDFNKIVIGTDKNIYFINPSDNSVAVTRANIGIKNGYSLASVPATSGFPGGLMFVSTLNDVRVINGLQALPVATSLDNVSTENWAQNVRGTLEGDLTSATNIYATFFNYKYHLIVDSVRYVYDIRTNGWTYHDISTDSYTWKPYIMAVLNNVLYNGQEDGWIEQEYVDTQYRDEDVEAFIESPYLLVSKDYKFVQKMVMWFQPVRNTTLAIEIVSDNNRSFSLESEFKLLDTSLMFESGIFDSSYYDDLAFNAEEKGMDYKVININRNIRWIKYKLTVTEGSISYQGFELHFDQLANKEL